MADSENQPAAALHFGDNGQSERYRQTEVLARYPRKCFDGV